MREAFYLKKLKADFSHRQRTNRAYSLRAYARDLAIHPSTLSQILAGKRPLPLKDVPSVLNRLQLNAKEYTLFVDSVGKKHVAIDQIKIPEEDDRYLLDEAYYQIIAEWEHYAVLTLFDCVRFNASVGEIAERLAISPNRAEVVLENLLCCGLVNRTTDGKLVKSHSRVRTTEDVTSQALRASHRETLRLGLKKIEDVSTELRDFSSLMVALDLRKLPEAKVIIREFRQKMLQLLGTGTREEIYQLAIQFYPLTHVKPETLKKGK